MSTARLLLAVGGTSSPRAPLLGAWGTSRFPTPSTLLSRRPAHEHPGIHPARRARRRGRRRRAQLLPHQALHLVGLRLVHLDRREHAHDRLHREGHRGSGWRARRESCCDEPPHRRSRLGLPRRALRVPDGDGRLGALGRDDRVHVHGAALAADAPRRHGRLLRALRPPARGVPVHGLRLVLRPVGARRRVHGSAGRPGDRLRSRSWGSE